MLEFKKIKHFENVSSRHLKPEGYREEDGPGYRDTLTPKKKCDRRGDFPTGYQEKDEPGY